MFEKYLAEAKKVYEFNIGNKKNIVNSNEQAISFRYLYSECNTTIYNCVVHIQD